MEVHLGYSVDGNYDAGLLLFSVSDFKARCGPPVLHRRSGSSCAQHGRLSLLKANYGRECVVTLNDVRNVLYAYYTAFREDSLPHNISPLICVHLLLIVIELHARPLYVLCPLHIVFLSYLFFVLGWFFHKIPQLWKNIQPLDLQVISECYQSKGKVKHKEIVDF